MTFKQGRLGEKPILFRTDMVRARRAGTKTQTRRLVKPQPPEDWEPVEIGPGWSNADGDYGVKPKFYKGDTLWVRETWMVVDVAGGGSEAAVVYRADENPEPQWVPVPVEWAERVQMMPWEIWRPSIFMPRWASRDTPLVTDVRVQRVQEISAGDCLAEGIPMAVTPTEAQFVLAQQWAGGFDAGHCQLARVLFMKLWNSIHARPKFGRHNPYTGVREDCYVSYPWAAIREMRQHRGRAWYVVGNPWVAVYGLTSFEEATCVPRAPGR